MRKSQVMGGPGQSLGGPGGFPGGFWCMGFPRGAVDPKKNIDPTEKGGSTPQGEVCQGFGRVLAGVWQGRNLALSYQTPTKKTPGRLKDRKLL